MSKIMAHLAHGRSGRTCAVARREGVSPR